MPEFELKDLLQALGPTASLIFAAWIFLSFLQSRYTVAYQLYRSLIAELRSHAEQDKRRASLVAQILEYKRRCELMRRATNIGVVSAIVLISALVFAGFGTIFENASLFKYLTAICGIGGLLLVVWAASLVIVENCRLQRLMEIDLSDIPELEERVRGRGLTD
jgi:hypothetical protein